jgi:hypothetical protein
MLLPLVPVEKLLLLVALPLVPFRTVVWAKPVPATERKTSQRKKCTGFRPQDFY